MDIKTFADNRKELQKPQTQNYKLTINGRSSFSVSGVKQVVKTSPEHISVELSGNLLDVMGKNFSITKLSIDEGLIEVNGEVIETQFKQSKDKTPFFKRIFK